jgi:hypothetical protein
MEEKLLVVRPEEENGGEMSGMTTFLKASGEEEEGRYRRLDDVLAFALAGIPHDTVRTAGEFFRALAENGKKAVPSDRILFAVALGRDGINAEYLRILRLLRRNPRSLDGYTGGLIVDGESELFTKSTATELVFSANCAGCAFIGHPLVEGTGSLRNFRVAAKNLGTDDLLVAYRDRAGNMVKNLLNFPGYPSKSPRLTVLHASSHSTSNTFALWRKVSEGLSGIACEEIGLRNGTLSDCSGCPYKMCLHYGEKESCFYGGVMVENVYPSVRAADAILMVCPNYNDSLSANLTAFINRLTALYRKRQFYDKALFAIIVSGYSGSDIVARQLIAALNMNKSFYLPPRFAMLETANDPGTALALPGIAERCGEFAENIRRTLCL